MAFSGTVFSIAFFNFAGISVTKEMSATTRMVLDSVRTLVIWGVSLAIGWQPFQALQLLGFAVLVTGMCVYNDIVIGTIMLIFFVLFSASKLLFELRCLCVFPSVCLSAKKIFSSKMDQIRKFGEQTSRILEFKPKGLD